MHTHSSHPHTPPHIPMCTPTLLTPTHPHTSPCAHPLFSPPHVHTVVLYAISAVYFAGVMVRLMLTLTPIVCVLSAIAISHSLDNYMKPVFSLNKEGRNTSPSLSPSLFSPSFPSPSLPSLSFPSSFLSSSSPLLPFLPFPLLYCPFLHICKHINCLLSMTVTDMNENAKMNSLFIPT